MVWPKKKKKNHSRYEQIYKIFLAVNINRSFWGNYRFIERSLLPFHSCLLRSYIIVVEEQNRELGVDTVCVSSSLSVPRLLQICVSTTATKIVNLPHHSCPHLQCHTRTQTHTHILSLVPSSRVRAFHSLHAAYTQ